jgi:hypothetical protein
MIESKECVIVIIRYVSVIAVIYPFDEYEFLTTKNVKYKFLFYSYTTIENMRRCISIDCNYTVKKKLIYRTPQNGSVDV